MLVEVVAGILVHSLALVSDAAHMLADAGALVLALVASVLSARPARGALTYGFKRVEILSAQVNGATLLVLGLLITYEGVRRVIAPPDVIGLTVAIVAVCGIGVNLAATLALSRANRQSMNVEGAFQHILTDLAAFILTAVAGLVVFATGFAQADGIASLIIAAIMLRAGFALLRDSGRVFLEAAPKGLDPDSIGNALAWQPGVSEVHDLHVWEVTSGFVALSAHVLVDPATDCHEIRHDLEAVLRDRFQIEHTTLQVDHRSRELLDIEVPDKNKPPK
jgi:cobalt-zinc-cadmium efflux system protein